MILPLAEPLRKHIALLSRPGDPLSPIHPKAFDLVERQRMTGHLSNQFADLLAAAGLRQAWNQKRPGSRRDVERHIDKVARNLVSGRLSGIFEGRRSKKLPLNIQRTARRKLLSLAASVNLADLAALPGNRFERLKDDRKGQYSIRINDQWRICFLWRNANAEQVEIVDYH